MIILDNLRKGNVHKRRSGRVGGYGASEKLSEIYLSLRGGVSKFCLNMTQSLKIRKFEDLFA